MISFEKLFIESKGKPIKYGNRELVMMDRFKMSNEVLDLTLTFLQSNSNWKQGIKMETDGVFEVNGAKINKALVLWKDNAPKSVKINVQSKSQEILVYNIWDVGDGIMQSWHNGAAMEVVGDFSIRKYYCNDGFPNDDFDDLIFQITR